MTTKRIPNVGDKVIRVATSLHLHAGQEYTVENIRKDGPGDYRVMVQGKQGKHGKKWFNLDYFTLPVSPLEGAAQEYDDAMEAISLMEKTR